jgi:DNA-binding Lrp family transcriptional regulator
MVTAIILVKVDHGKVNEVAEKLEDMQGVAEVYSVAGRVDLAAMIRVKTNEEVADLVTNHLLKVEGIKETETLLAFRAYSRHDLETMFSLGFEK